jgi:hypothetical protein
LTSDFAAKPERVLSGNRDADELDVRTWLGGSRGALVTEEVLGLGRYGKCLTVLSSTSLGHEDLEDPGDDEESLEKSWTPRFRR